MVCRANVQESVVTGLQQELQRLSPSRTPARPARPLLGTPDLVRKLLLLGSAPLSRHCFCEQLSCALIALRYRPCVVTSEAMLAARRCRQRLSARLPCTAALHSARPGALAAASGKPPIQKRLRRQARRL